MSAHAVTTFNGSRLRLSRRDVKRALLAGSAWGLMLSAGLTAVTAWSCGSVCLPEVAVNAGLSLAGGVLGIGPVAAYGGRRWSIFRRSVQRFAVENATNARI